jgi:hypothetical protein
MELNEPDEYRREAQRIRKRAAEVTTKTVRQRMLTIAADYEQLAASMEAVRRGGDNSTVREDS